MRQALVMKSESSAVPIDAKKTKQTTRKGAYAMGSIRPYAKTNTLSEAPIRALLLCPTCDLEMGLLGVESESQTRDLYTFECSACGGLEVRGVRVRLFCTLAYDS